MRFSATRLSTWMSCSLQAKFKYVDGLPGRQNAKAAFGKIIHHCLEQYESNGHDLEAVLDEFRDLWQNPEKADAAIDYYPRFTTFAGLRDKGLDILRAYHDKNRWGAGQVLALEHPFLVPFGDHELTGFVDKLELAKSGNGKDVLRVVDYKTNARKPSMAELAINIQFTCYIYASLHWSFWEGVEGDPKFPGIPNGAWYFETLKDVPRRGIWHGLWTGSEHDVGARGDEDFERLHRVLDEIAKATDRDVYVPNISGDSCGLCDYVEPCGLAIPSLQELAEQEDAWL